MPGVLPPLSTRIVFPMTIQTEELFELLRHWAEARRKRLYDDKIALQENLRCAVDVADLLRQVGADVPPELFKDSRFLR